jgi:hypothetical protein
LPIVLANNTCQCGQANDDLYLEHCRTHSILLLSTTQTFSYVTQRLSILVNIGTAEIIKHARVIAGPCCTPAISQCFEFLGRWFTKTILKMEIFPLVPDFDESFFAATKKCKEVDALTPSSFVNFKELFVRSIHFFLARASSSLNKCCLIFSVVSLAH